MNFDEFSQYSVILMKFSIFRNFDDFYWIFDDFDEISQYSGILMIFDVISQFSRILTIIDEI